MFERDIINYVDRQLNFFSPDGEDSKSLLKKHLSQAMDRVNFSIDHVTLSGYQQFSVYHSDLYAQFLYYLSNEIWRAEGLNLVSTKLFQLNKSLHSLNCMYDTILPDIFLLIHCVGTVIGKANYADRLVVCQNVTIGADRGHIPTFEGPCYFGPGSAAIGNCLIKPYSFLGVGSYLLNRDSKDHCLVCRPGSPETFLPIKRNIIDETYFTLADSVK
jgi:serine O-acetyltransferase